MCTCASTESFVAVESKVDPANWNCDRSPGTAGGRTELENEYFVESAAFIRTAPE